VLACSGGRRPELLPGEVTEEAPPESAGRTERSAAGERASDRPDAARRCVRPDDGPLGAVVLLGSEVELLD
jgi:hypothetical protein